MSRTVTLLVLCVIQFNLLAQMQYKGLSVVAPYKEPENGIWADIKAVNSNAISLMPYAYSREGSNEVVYNNSRQHWGETEEGVRKMIRDAHSNNLSVMLKPHLWLMPNTYTGKLTFEDEKDWEVWTESYLKYIFYFAEIAEEEGTDMFCLATEMQSMWKEYPTGFLQLIEGVKKRYKGKLTYASNWDEYNSFPFWTYFDFIGIDAYFPIEKTNIKGSFKKLRQDIEAFAKQKKKSIIFTEWGFRSIADPYTKPWESYGEEKANNEIQAEAYNYFFESWQNSEHLAGVYVWKWFVHGSRGQRGLTGFTPQNKPAEQIIGKYYK